MSTTNFDRKLDALSHNVTSLQRHLGEGPDANAAARLLGELEASLEELRVAQEEIEQQNDALIDEQSELRAQRLRYYDLFEFAPDPYLVTDTSGMTEDANQAASTLLGTSILYIATRPLAVFIDVEDRNAFRRFLTQVSSTSFPAETVLNMRKHRGSCFKASLRAAGVANSRGQISHVRWLVRDISEQVQREESLSMLASELERRVQERTADLEEALQRLHVALRAKDEFLGLVSHELKTPITTIYGNAQVLRNRGQRLSDEERDASLWDIEDEANRLHRVIENLLIVSQVEAGRSTETEPVLLQRVIHDVLRRRPRLTARRRIEVIEDGTLPPAAAEPIYVEQLLENLVGNADKYSAPGETIEVHLETEGPEVAVRVFDRGPGIEPGEADRLFDAFYRSPRTANEASGTGIGLSVCKRLIEAQHGRIWARPREGGGTEFGFALPIEHVEE